MHGTYNVKNLLSISRYCMVSVRINLLAPSLAPCKYYSALPYASFGPPVWTARSSDPSPLDCYLWRHMKDMVYRQKPHAREEHLQRNMQSADRVRENDEIIREAANSVGGAHKCTSRTVEGYLLWTVINVKTENLLSSVLSNQNWFFFFCVTLYLRSAASVV